MYALIAGKQLRYEVMGSGLPAGRQDEPILLVHGWGGSSESLAPLGKLLSKKYKVILLDLPGFGKSDLPDSSWGVEEYTNVLVNLLESLKVKKVTYFGHSFGGGLGIYLAATKPDFVKALILCNSSYKRTTKISVLAKIFHHFFPKNNPPFRRFLYSVLFRSSDISTFPQLEQNFRKIITQDLTDLSKKIKCDTLLIWGEYDQITPARWAKELHNNLPNSILKIIPHTRHSLPLRSPEVVASEMFAFLED